MCDWAHCNVCFTQPSKEKQFYVTTCSHIFCFTCFDKSSRKLCIICESKCTGIQITSKMKPEVEIFFTDPKEIVNRQRDTLIKVMNFQNYHRKKWFYHNKHKVSTSMGRTQTAVDLANRLDRELMKTTEENNSLKKALSTSQQSVHHMRPGPGPSAEASLYQSKTELTVCSQEGCSIKQRQTQVFKNTVYPGSGSTHTYRRQECQMEAIMRQDRQLGGQLGALVDEISALKESQHNLRSRLAEQDHEIENLHKQLADKEWQVSSLKDELCKSTLRNKNLSKVIDGQNMGDPQMIMPEPGTPKIHITVPEKSFDSEEQKADRDELTSEATPQQDVHNAECGTVEHRGAEEQGTVPSRSKSVHFSEDVHQAERVNKSSRSGGILRVRGTTCAAGGAGGAYPHNNPAGTQSRLDRFRYLIPHRAQRMHARIPTKMPTRMPTKMPTRMPSKMPARMPSMKRIQSHNVCRDTLDMPPPATLPRKFKRVKKSPCGTTKSKIPAGVYHERKVNTIPPMPKRVSLPPSRTVHMDDQKWDDQKWDDLLKQLESSS